MSYLAAFGGILLTFLAGTEIDTDLMREKFKESFLIGFLSFLVPSSGCFSLPISVRSGVSKRR
jgi:Kef-type K+ transport system membrane component KefB